MITIELAKMLKDRGFPQTLPNDYVANENVEWVHLPTLSELIEACKCDGWFELTENPIKSMRVWEARMNHGITREPEISDGSNPEEAVAELWLKLNKK